MNQVLLRFNDVGLHPAGADGPTLEHLSFDLAEGDALILTGPPACGKSAALDLACGVRGATSGHVERLATNIGWLPQTGALVSNLTLWDNVALPLRWHRAATNQEVQRAITDLCEVMECDPPPRIPAAAALTEHRAVAAVARALILRPPLLIADEPGGELGTDGRDDLWRMLWRVQASWGTAILAATTDPGPAQALTDRRLDLPGRRTMAFRLWRGAWAGQP